MVHETIHLGVFVMFGVIMLPVYAMLVGWFVGKPRDLVRSTLGLGYLVGFIAVIIVATWIAGQVIRLIMHV